MTARVLMYTKKVCPYCVMAEKLLQSRGVQHIEKIFIDGDEQLRDQMMAKTGRRTVPQIYIGERHVGGYDDLTALDRQGRLVSILEES